VQDLSDPIYKNINKNSPAAQQYVTHVYKCDKNGRSDINYSYYMKEYNDSGLARKGHREVVELMEEGRLNF
jgi:hypothetical protein